MQRADPSILTNGNRPATTDVGTWYCTYYDDNWDNVGGMGYVPTYYRPLCSDTPDDYRTYRADDAAVIDYHLAQLAAAQIDFILFEVTPGGLGGYRLTMQPFVDKARAVCERLALWNAGNPWKIRYAIAAGAHYGVYQSDPVGLCMEREAQEVWETFVTNPAYGGEDTCYQLNGKPLLVYWGDPEANPRHWAAYEGDKTYGERFSIRYASDVRAGTYGWNIYASGTVLHPEVEVVSPGWGHYTRAEPPYVERQAGRFYQRCWDTVLGNSLPAIVMVVTFNDYLENTAVWTADTSAVTDADRWLNPAGELDPALYWRLTVDNIRRLRKG
ncbi:MAG: hypothetical protein GXY52_02320 [Chloroflexi bacterium]|nr:hypothetical protein [Chloroflexota bacterium]